MTTIKQNEWKALERTTNETIAYVDSGPYEGLEISMDWSQGAVRPRTKRERLLSIICDTSLVEDHMRTFGEVRLEAAKILIAKRVRMFHEGGAS